MTLYGLWHVVDALALKKKPWRVVDMIYEDLRVCNILDPHLMVLEFVSCTGRIPWHIEDNSWVKSTQSCLKHSKCANEEFMQGRLQIKFQHFSNKSASKIKNDKLSKMRSASNIAGRLKKKISWKFSINTLSCSHLRIWKIRWSSEIFVWGSRRIAGAVKFVGFCASIISLSLVWQFDYHSWRQLQFFQVSGIYISSKRIRVMRLRQPK